MSVYGNRSARCRAIFLKFALANKAPPGAADIGICFAVIGHMDNRDWAAHLVFDFHDELHKHVGIEGVEKVQVRVGGEWGFECASAEYVDVGETSRPAARVFGDIGVEFDARGAAGEFRLDEKRQHATRAAPYVKKVGFFGKIQVRKEAFQNEVRCGRGIVRTLLRKACRAWFGQRAAAQRAIAALIGGEELIFVGNVQWCCHASCVVRIHDRSILFAQLDAQTALGCLDDVFAELFLQNFEGALAGAVARVSELDAFVFHTASKGAHSRGAACCTSRLIGTVVFRRAPCLRAVRDFRHSVVAFL